MEKINSPADFVERIVERMADLWGPGVTWQLDKNPQPHEAQYLKLDCSKAKARLDWHPRWSLANALESIAAWHRAYLDRADMKTVTLSQIKQYTSIQA